MERSASSRGSVSQAARQPAREREPREALILMKNTRGKARPAKGLAKPLMRSKNGLKVVFITATFHCFARLECLALLPSTANFSQNPYSFVTQRGTKGCPSG